MNPILDFLKRNAPLISVRRFHMGELAFRAAAPHLWNELPLQLRTVGSVETFKN